MFKTLRQSLFWCKTETNIWVTLPDVLIILKCSIMSGSNETVSCAHSYFISVLAYIYSRTAWIEILIIIISHHCIRQIYFEITTLHNIIAFTTIKEVCKSYFAKHPDIFNNLCECFSSLFKFHITVTILGK